MAFRSSSSGAQRVATGLRKSAAKKKLPDFKGPTSARGPEETKVMQRYAATVRDKPGRGAEVGKLKQDIKFEGAANKAQRQFNLGTKKVNFAPMGTGKKAVAAGKKREMNYAKDRTKRVMRGSVKAAAKDTATKAAARVGPLAMASRALGAVSKVAKHPIVQAASLAAAGLDYLNRTAPKTKTPKYKSKTRK